MASLINNPPIGETLAREAGQTPPPAWALFFGQLFRAAFAVYQSGTTAQRPTKDLWIGRPYLDTTLGIPIWYDGSGWIDATGASV